MAIGELLIWHGSTCLHIMDTITRSDKIVLNQDLLKIVVVSITEDDVSWMTFDNIWRHFCCPTFKAVGEGL